MTSAYDFEGECRGAIHLLGIRRAIGACRVSFASLLVAGAAACSSEPPCDGTYDQAAETLSWSVTDSAGAVLTSGCSLTRIGASASADDGIPLYSDVVQFSASIGDTVRVVLDEEARSVHYSQLCGAAPPVRASESALFCSQVPGGGDLLDGCETQASADEPAQIVSRTTSAAIGRSILVLKVTGAGVLHVRAGDVANACAPLAQLPPFGLLTIRAK